MPTKKGGNIVRQKVRYLITGALAGLANGFFGAGGGLFLVPLFTGWLKMEPKKAFATSVAVIFPLCAVAAGLFWWRGGAELGSFWPYWLGGAAGGVISGTLFRKIPVIWLRRAFGLLILYGGVRAVLLL